MIDATDLGEKRGRAETVLPEASIERIYDMYHSWRDGDSPVPDECSSVATFNAIVNNDFVVDPRRYVAGPTSFVDEKALTARKAELQKTLVGAMRAATLADEKLLHTLRGDR
jgi:type I restriction-modification system DNA methylase subunit